MESISKLKLINDKWPLRPVPPSHRHPALVIKLKTSTTVNHLVNTINANIYNISIFNIQHSTSLLIQSYMSCANLVIVIVGYGTESS